SADKPPRHSSLMPQHENEQVTVVPEGEFTVHTEEEKFGLGKFDSVHFSATEPHRIENSGQERAVGPDVFAPARSFDFWRACSSLPVRE
ncbi:MAG: cupin domain-containing protein, partial [Candidatus Bipolaricaulia bacterium]